MGHSQGSQGRLLPENAEQRCGSRFECGFFVASDVVCFAYFLSRKRKIIKTCLRLAMPVIIAWLLPPLLRGRLRPVVGCHLCVYLTTYISVVNWITDGYLAAATAATRPVTGAVAPNWRMMDDVIRVRQVVDAAEWWNLNLVLSSPSNLSLIGQEAWGYVFWFDNLESTADGEMYESSLHIWDRPTRKVFNTILVNIHCDGLVIAR